DPDNIHDGAVVVVAVIAVDRGISIDFRIERLMFAGDGRRGPKPSGIDGRAGEGVSRAEASIVDDADVGAELKAVVALGPRQIVDDVVNRDMKVAGTGERDRRVEALQVYSSVIRDACG